MEPGASTEPFWEVFFQGGKKTHKMILYKVGLKTSCKYDFDSTGMGV